MRLLHLMLSLFPLFMCEDVIEDLKLSQVVNTSDGRIQGRIITTYGNQSGIGFLGVPIAKPPVGELRLHVPSRNDPWEGVLLATQYRNACVSDPIGTYSDERGGPVHEDCLYLNVLTNDHCLQNGGCSVVAVIHGGKLTIESPVSYPIEPIVNNFVGQNRNVIVVFLPYRLNFLGWLNLSPEVDTFAKRNLGIYDVEIGFQWIQREIASFGGDPTKVCAFGHSAGGQIIDMVSMSPRFDDLFQSTILMSSNALGLDNNEGLNTDISRRIAIEVGCATVQTTWNNRTEVEKALECLMRKPSSEILKVQQKFASREVDDYYGIPIDGYFFTKPFEEVLSTRKLRPTLLGTVTGEFGYPRFLEDENGIPKGNELHILCRNYLYGFGYRKVDELIQLCEEFYRQPFRTHHFFDDSAYFYAASRTGKSLARGGNQVYMYSFSYGGVGDAFDRKFIGFEQGAPKRPLHCEDFIYVFGLHRGPFTPKDYEIERIYSGMLVNFVNGQNPAPDGHDMWPLYEETKQEYFNFDFDENLKMPGAKTAYYKEVVEFWDMVNRRSGGRRPLTHFPDGIDIFRSMDVIKGQDAHLNANKTINDPSIKGLETMYLKWNAVFDTAHRYHNRSSI